MPAKADGHQGIQLLGHDTGQRQGDATFACSLLNQPEILVMQAGFYPCSEIPIDHALPHDIEYA